MWLWVRIVGLVGIIIYGVAGAGLGLAQQVLGQPTTKIDCDYRVRLIRDRTLALTERSSTVARGDPQDDAVSNLIRETLAACAGTDAQPKLETLENLFDAHRGRRSFELEATDAVLAL
jgi:hypothetical protein